MGVKQCPNIEDLRYADGTTLIADNNTNMRIILPKVDAAGSNEGLNAEGIIEDEQTILTGTDSKNFK